MTSSKRRRKSRKTFLNNIPSNILQLTKQAYEDREQICSYQDYLSLITLAAFNEHEIKHLHIEKYKNNTQIERELLKRWKKLPLEERNKYENEAIDNDIFHQIAYTRIDYDESSAIQHLNIRKELEIHWNDLPEAERIVHKRAVTNRDIQRKRLL